METSPGFVVLHRFVPLEDGMLFLYGDRGVLFGEGRGDEITQAFSLNHFERALNPVPRVESFATFDRPGSINYSSSAQICLDGARGWMYGINGRGFYDVISRDLPVVLEQLGAASLEGYVVASHSRLMARALRSVGRVEITGSGRMNSHDMHWVVVRAK